MSAPVSRRRVGAILRRELRDYRRNRYMLVSMGVIPAVFLAEPLIYVLRLPPSASVPLSHQHQLLYMLGIPALVPALVAAASVVTERAQGTLEPVLTTPVRREELLLGKALAPLLPSVAVSYLVYGLFVCVIELFAHPGVAPALLQAPVVIAQVIFTPLIAAFSIWVGLAISTLSRDIRAAQQLSMLCNLPVVAFAVLTAFNVIHPTLGLAVGAGAALLAAYRVGWRVVSALFDRERLVSARGR
ncbi:MAG TPA: ABC transporter permease subunit [Solirubrobacteraceae bacterium]|nr:ABC transporter permease subunit [Solirubrobacteraceae bacterium]